MNADNQSVAELLAALGLKLSTIIPSAVGALVAMRVSDELSMWQRWFTFVCGLVLATYSADPIITAFDLKAKLEPGIALVMGLFGMALSAAAIKALREIPFGDLFKAAVKAATDKWLSK